MLADVLRRTQTYPDAPMAINHRRPQAGTEPLAIGRVMARLMARTGYAREQGTSAVASAWQKVVPESLKVASQPGAVRRGVLEVFVSHSAHVQELGFQKRDLVRQLNELLPAAGITDIRCRLLADAGRTT